jgi:hypothetical protein
MENLTTKQLGQKAIKDIRQLPEQEKAKLREQLDRKFPR